MARIKAKGNCSQGIRRSDVVSETGWAAIQQPDPTWTYTIAFCKIILTQNLSLVKNL